MDVTQIVTRVAIIIAIVTFEMTHLTSTSPILEAEWTLPGEYVQHKLKPQRTEKWTEPGETSLNFGP